MYLRGIASLHEGATFGAAVVKIVAALPHIQYNPIVYLVGKVFWVWHVPHVPHPGYDSDVHIYIQYTLVNTQTRGPSNFNPLPGIRIYRCLCINKALKAIKKVIVLRLVKISQIYKPKQILFLLHIWMLCNLVRIIKQF